MSRCTSLVMFLSLAACEHATPSTNPPTFPEPASKTEAMKAPAPEPAPAPVAEVAPAPAPAIAPVKPKVVKRAVSPKPAPVAVDRVGELPKNGSYYPPGCRPGSRMMCRWREDADERQLPRVTKKPAPITDTATETP